MSYQRCTTLGSLIEVVKTSSVSRRSYARVACRATTRITRDVPIQFISSALVLNPHGEMDGRINGCTWGPYSSLEHPGMRQGLPLSLLESSNALVERGSIFFLFLSLVSFHSFISSFIHPLFFYSLHRARLCPSSGHPRYSKTSSQSGNILSSSGNLINEQNVTYRREQSQDP